MSELDNLTQEQTEKVLQFQDLTGMVEFPICIEILQRHDWNLDLAVNEIVDHSEDSFTEAPSDGVVNNASLWQRILQSVNYFGLRGLLRFFIRITYNAISGLLQLFRSDTPRVTDPTQDVVSFIDYYEQKYGNRHPVFYRGPYSEALNEAKRDLRFLLVYLHCEDHQDTTTFCAETLPNPEVILYIDSRMLFWACSVTSPEGYRVSQALRENGYPFLAMEALVDGRMTVVGRLEGALESADLIAALSDVIRDNEGALVLARAERYQRSLDQALRRQQDQAYLESLTTDQEKERRKREEQEVAVQHQLEAERNQKLIELKKLEISSRIPEEPLAHDPESLQIVFKLPNGTRLERRFLRSHSLKHLYYFIYCNPAAPNSFEISTNFPRRVLQCQEGEDDVCVQTLEEAGLNCKEVLFVRDLEA